MPDQDNEHQEAPVGRSHIAPQKGDSVLYKMKVFAPFVGLLVLAVGFTWFFTNYDKRISHLETFASETTTQVQNNTEALAYFKQWAPTVDFKLSLLLEHFGIRVPDTIIPSGLTRING